MAALVCSMSMNAQQMKVMKGDKVIATYTAEQARLLTLIAYRLTAYDVGWRSMFCSKVLAGS